MEGLVALLWGIFIIYVGTPVVVFLAWSFVEILRGLWSWGERLLKGSI